MQLTPPTINTPTPWAGKSVGILGGSFNPAHEGHRNISTYALEHLELDAIWWMVSPQNPLKSLKAAPIDERMQKAMEISNHEQIIVTDIETHLNTKYTAETLRKLQEHFPDTNFVWLMGVDNLKQINQWDEWEQIFDMVPIAVLNRPTDDADIEQYPAVKHFTHARLPLLKKTALKTANTPAWLLLDNPQMDISSTQIRSKSKLHNKNI